MSHCPLYGLRYLGSSLLKYIGFMCQQQATYLKFLLSNLVPCFHEELGHRSPPWIIRSSSHSSCVLTLAFNLGNLGSKGEISGSGRPGSVIYFVPFGGHSSAFDSLLPSFLPLRKRFRILGTIPFPTLRDPLLSPFVRRSAIVVLGCV